MGSALLPILTVTLSSTVLGELVKTVTTWLGSRRQVALEIELEGRRVRVETEGNETAEALLRQIEPLLRPQGRPRRPLETY
jgi:hypothetical protein